MNNTAKIALRLSLNKDQQRPIVGINIICPEDEKPLSKHDGLWSIFFNSKQSVKGKLFRDHLYIISQPVANGEYLDLKSYTPPSVDPVISCSVKSLKREFSIHSESYFSSLQQEFSTANISICKYENRRILHKI